MRALPEGVELVTDVSVAQWVVDGLRSWGRDHVPVTSIVPGGFDAYARIPHPGQSGGIGDDIPGDQVESLIEALSGFTSTPDSCWLCVWSGYGFWYTRSHAVMVFGDPDGRVKAEYDRVAREREQLIDGVPQVETQGREYFLFYGPISAAGSLVFEIDGSPQSPNLWWPDDRTWCVASEIDLPTTYVGGSLECIERLLDVPVLNASQTGPDDQAN
ncbi:MAG: hypothetical protein ACRDH8_14560 [Actinomycetota bacterium]